MRLARVAAGAVAAVALAGCGQAVTPGSDPPGSAGAFQPAATTPADGARDPSLPAGWRWESFMDAELAVPGSWAYGTAGDPWCLRSGAGQPYVGRPGPVRDIGCAGMDQDPRKDPAFSLTTGGTFVWFTPRADGAQAQAGQAATAGDRLTLFTGGAKVEIQAPDKLRQQIAGTLRTIEQDQNGCPITHPVSRDPAWRPPGAGGIAQYPDAELVSACRYTLAAGADRDRPAPAATLISSLRLTGAAAAQAVGGLDGARMGGGPNAAASCSKDYAYGEEVIVLRITYEGGVPDRPHETVLRYSGCDHHGFDNGDTVHRLTAASVAPFITGPNQVNVFSGELGAVLRPDQVFNGKGDPNTPVSSP